MRRTAVLALALLASTFSHAEEQPHPLMDLQPRSSSGEAKAMIGVGATLAAGGVVTALGAVAMGLWSLAPALCSDQNDPDFCAGKEREGRHSARVAAGLGMGAAGLLAVGIPVLVLGARRARADKLRVAVTPIVGGGAYASFGMPL